MEEIVFPPKDTRKKLPPKAQIAARKGGSSFYINKSTNRKLPEWQRGFGVVGFGTKVLPWVVKYVLNQKDHHKIGMTHDRLEKYSDEDG